MQENRNNSIQKGKSNKGFGLAGTIIIHAGLFLLLISLGFSIPPPKDISDEGIMVNFGTGDTGLGDIEPSPPGDQEETAPSTSAAQEETAPTTTAATTKTEEEALLADKNAETPKVKKVDPEAEKKKLEKIEANKKLREEREAERIKKQQEDEAERIRIEAEQKYNAAMNRTKNALANSKNAGTSSTSEGIAGGTGNQGVVTGSIDSKVRGDGNGTGTSGVGNGISYDLHGRGVQTLKNPKYDYQGEGKVVVEVSVDRDGKVIQAVPGVKGSNTLDEYLLKAAKEAALGATFKVDKNAPAVQKGTITYNFKLN